MTAPTRLGARQASRGAPASRRTLRAMVATGLGLAPLTELFTDARWLFQAVAAIIIVGGSAAVLRYWQPPRAWHPLPGLMLLVPWLTWRFAPEHALGGFLPTSRTFTDISHLIDKVRQTMRDGVAPVHADRSITLVLAVLTGLLVFVVDEVAVVARRPALAGVPLLVLFTVSGAVTRHPVQWLLFCISAAAFLLVLSVGARDEVREWGRLIPRAGEARPSAGLAVSGPRIAITAILVAVIVPFVVPSRGSNVLANSLHHSGAGGSGTGIGGVSLDPFAALQGELQRNKAVTLFTVKITGASGTQPFYLRANVLNDFTDAGWTVGTHGGGVPIDAAQALATIPATPTAPATPFEADISISGLSDNPPLFALPTGLLHVSSLATWAPDDQLLLSAPVTSGDQYTELVSQPTPTIAQLSAAGSVYPASVLGDEQVSLPPSVLSKVTSLVELIIKGAGTPYARARALSDFFTSPASGFIYSLQTKTGDSGSALLDFLQNRTGYCQQFAAALGIMLRIAQIPARVVLGYTHPALDSNGSFAVTTDNAHAWVEAFFPGLGWIPFDPTPISLAAGAATVNLPWAPHPVTQSGGSGVVPRISSSVHPHATSTGQGPSVTASKTAHGSTALEWALLGVLAAVVVFAGVAGVPAAIRWARRRRRLRAAADGDPDPLWAELTDTARDLGYVWSPARTPRQVVGWLAPDIGAEAAADLQQLATAVETARYARPAPPASARSLLSVLTAVERRLRSHRGRSTRIRSRLLPASLGWPRSLPGRRRSH